LRPYSDNPAINGGDDEQYDTQAEANGDYKIINGAKDVNGDPRLYGDKIDIGAYELQTDPLPAPTPPVYHTVTLEVAPGIDLYNLTAGDLVVEEGGHLHVQFMPGDVTATAADVLFLVDGVETTFKDFGGSSYFSYILNPVEQDHSVLIAMRKYTVTLPDIEGATIDVGPGDHSVPYYNSFTFSLTLAEGVDPEEVQVYANGTELSPANFPQYSINAVTGPVEIRIEGVNPTGNTQIAGGKVNIGVESGKLKVESEQTVDVAVYTIEGKNIVQLRRVYGSKIITLPAGIYVVRAGETISKVVIP